MVHHVVYSGGIVVGVDIVGIEKGPVSKNS